MRLKIPIRICDWAKGRAGGEPGVPFAPAFLLHVPLAPRGVLEHPERHSSWVSRGVTREVLLG